MPSRHAITPQGTNPIADAAIAEFRACTTAAEIEAVATKYRAEVIKMEVTDPERWRHVVNAKRIYMKRIKHDHRDT